MGDSPPSGPEVSQKLPAARVGTRRTRFPPQLEPPVERILGLVTAQGLNDSLRPKHENWHTDTMLDSDGCGAEHYVGNQSVSMGAHRHQVATILLNPTDDFLDRFAERQFRLGGNVHRLKLCSNLF